MGPIDYLALSKEKLMEMYSTGGQNNAAITAALNIKNQEDLCNNLEKLDATIEAASDAACKLTTAANHLTLGLAFIAVIALAVQLAIARGCVSPDSHRHPRREVHSLPAEVDASELDEPGGADARRVEQARHSSLRGWPV